ncbi:hypothetical protein KY366_07955 [Candidatus Woesearchaeota archaeon]|nr:hypothetical protein [Candidatus Woesearchaeota archaeon]
MLELTPEQRRVFEIVLDIIINYEDKAWRLTEFGEQLQPLVDGAVRFLPENYKLSACDVIGAMNSPAEKRASYARVNILRNLEEEDLSVRQLSEIVDMDIRKTQKKLDDLIDIENKDGEKLSFIEPTDSYERIFNNHVNIYQWTGKSLDRNDFRSRSSGLIDLIRILKKGGKDNFFCNSNLLKNTDYNTSVEVFQAMQTLKKRGYVNILKANDFRKYRITPKGERYVKECINPLIKDIIRIYPSPENLVKPS